MKKHAQFVGVALFLTASLLARLQPLQAVIIGVEQFDYPDGPIANQTGGTFWDWQNRNIPSPPGPSHTGTVSDWDNSSGFPAVASGRLVTNNSSARREYNGPGEGPSIETDEGYGAINNFSNGTISFQQHVVYYRVTFATGATLPSVVSINSSDFGTARVGFGASLAVPNDNKFSIQEFSNNTLTVSSTQMAANTTYTLVAKLDFVAATATLYLIDDLNVAESSQTPVRPPFAFNKDNWSTSVQLTSGTGGSVTWDNLVVATTWDELGAVVTTTADEDDGSRNPTANSGTGGSGVSLREAVKYAPSGSLITFAPALNGKTCTLGRGEMEIDKGLIIDASALANGVTIDANRTSRHFLITGSTPSLTLKALALTNGNGGGYGGDIGGAILLDTGNLFLQRCTLSGNSAERGGAIWLQSSGTSRLEECTLTGNRATAAVGGGIAVLGGSCALSRCTVSGNTGTDAGGGMFLQFPGSVSLSNCLIAGNTDSFANDIFRGDGTLTASGNNLIGSNATVSTIFPVGQPNVNGQYVGTQSNPLDPKLSPLGYFGGPTQTMHPLIGSPAIDAGNGTNPGGTDARGFPRFVDGDRSGTAELDLGAVEAGPLLGLVSNAGDGAGLTLRFRLSQVGTTPGARIGIVPEAGASGFTLAQGELEIPSTANGLFIDASNLSGPVTVSGNDASRVFKIDAGATVAMHNLAIVGGRTATGVSSSDSSGGSGGGILNAGSLSLISCNITGNRTGDGFPNTDIGSRSGNGGNGGGIDSSGRMSLISCRVAGNQTGRGGNGGNSSFGGNGGNGGGINSSGPMSLSLCSVAGNQTGNGGSAGMSGIGGNGGSGGGISNNTGQLSLSSCSVAGNQTGNGGSAGGFVGNGGNGGGIISNGPMSFSSCSVAGNQTGKGTSGSGGGIYVFSANPLSLLYSIVAANTGGSAPDIRGGTVTFQGVNLIGNTLGLGIQTGPAPLTGNPLLAPLGDYGGPTQTMPPLPGSPVINAASGSTATSDQRGFPIIGLPDLGAAEYQGTTDVRRYWTQDWDGDGIPFGIEHALGTDPTVNDRANTRNLSGPTFDAQGRATLKFGRNLAAMPNTISILKRSTDLLTFTEIFRINGNTPNNGTGISATVGASDITVFDPNPPFPKAFYRIDAVAP